MNTQLTSLKFVLALLQNISSNLKCDRKYKYIYHNVIFVFCFL